MAQIIITNNVPAAVAQMEKGAKKIAFATANAINKTGLAWQQEVLQHKLPGTFTLRSAGAPWQRPGTKYGVNMRFARASKLEASIGSAADWLKLQETGGIKQAIGHRLAIPTIFWKRREEILRKERKPRALLANAKAKLARAERAAERAKTKLSQHRSSVLNTLFRRRERSKLKQSVQSKLRTLERTRQIVALQGIALHTPFEAKLKTGIEGIFVRTTTNRLPIKMLFLFRTTAQVRERLFYERDGETFVRKRYRALFDAEIAKEVLHEMNKNR